MLFKVTTELQYANEIVANLSLYHFSTKIPEKYIVALIDLPKSCFESIYSCNQRLLKRANPPSF